MTKFERASGLTGIFAVEWGDSRWVNEEAQIKATKKTLAAARNECIAAKQGEAATDPLDPDHPGQPLRLKTDSEILKECDAMALNDWIANDQDRRQKYYRKLISQPIFGDYSGGDDTPLPVRWFVGAEGSYSNSTYSFLPNLTQLPPTFPKGDSEEKHDLYSFKIYGGRGIGTHTHNGQKILEAADVSVSLTYRRDFTFAAGTADQDVCAPSDTVIRCFKKNIAAPVELKGFVGGARIAGAFPSWGFLPKSAIEVRGTYDFSAKRYGLQIPIYFVPNEKGNPSGGVMFSCTGQGHVEGQKLSRDCKGAIFVSTDFKLDRR